jgi:ATP-dependent RNA helicase DDX1
MPDWNYHGLCPELLRAVQQENWLLPTPIQDEALPAILGGGDVCGAAETGSGKTAAFVLPILQLVQEELVNGGAMTVQKKSGETKSNSTFGSSLLPSSPPSTSAIKLSTSDRDSMLAVSQPDQLVCQSRSERQWQGVRATVGATTKSAKVYFEATVEDDGLCRVGWSTAAGKYDLGTDAHSWGFGGTGMKSHGRKFIAYGRAFGRGDVVGCYLDLSGKQGTCSFSLNGKMCGEAFNNIPANAVLYPACVLKNAQMSFEFNEMKYKCKDYVPIGQAHSNVLRGGAGGNNKSKKKGGNGGGGGGGGGSCRAIIMAPTRELAAQIYDWVNKLSKFINDPNIQSTLIVGGNDFKQNSNPNNAHIVIGTCGRLRDTLNRNKINTNNVRFFVLDEADQMVKDKESLSIVREIHQTLINTASKESARLQVCFFSATLHTPGVRELAEQMTYHATWVDLKGKDVVPETVDHLIVPVTSTSKSTPWGDSYKYDQFTDGVHSKDNLLMRRPVKNINNDSVALARSQVIKRMKLEAVKDIVDTFSMSTCMIFCRTNVDCNMLEEYFSFLSKQIGGGRGSKHQSGVKRESGKENIYSCVVVAGKRQQRERRENLEAFKDGDVRFLICTDVAARGIDLKELPFVINMTLPDEPEQYYHRIGRVGRAGRMGLAISIVACDGSDNEKVWYHSNCKNKKMCHQTKLVKHGGCCIYYNEKLCLKNIEDKLGEKILRMNSDSGGLTLPNNMNVNDYGELLSKKNSGGNNSKTSEHVQSVMPAVMELCEIEMETQKLWLQTKRKKY